MDDLIVLFHVFGCYFLALFKITTLLDAEK